MAGILVLDLGGADVEVVLKNLSVVRLGLFADIGVVKSALESADAWKCQSAPYLNGGSHTRG